MKGIAQVKLNPTLEQATALKRTLETANAACDYLSQIAFSTQTFSRLGVRSMT